MSKIPKLSDKQLDRLSEFSSNLGLVFIAGGIAPILSEGKINLFMLILSVILASISVVISLILLRI